jgi:hypothetical protein
VRASKILAGIALVAVLGTVVWWTYSYDPREFRGAAPMRDSGVFSYYRYHAVLGEIPLTSPGTYTLRFSGLPATNMVLQLYVAGGSDANRTLLENLTTEMSAEIVDSRGNVVCAVTGTPSATDPAKRWTLMSSLSQAAFWHERCRGATFARNTEYTLRMDVRNVDPRSPAKTLTVTLEGGGIELS